MGRARNLTYFATLRKQGGDQQKFPSKELKHPAERGKKKKAPFFCKTYKLSSQKGKKKPVRLTSGKEGGSGIPTKKRTSLALTDGNTARQPAQNREAGGLEKTPFKSVSLLAYIWPTRIQ